MQVLYPRCTRLDVHKDMVMARVRCVSDPPHDEVRSFGTTTSALLELNDWLTDTHKVPDTPRLPICRLSSCA